MTTRVTDNKRSPRPKVVRRRRRSVIEHHPDADTAGGGGDVTLIEALDRVLSRGVVVRGEVVIAVANIPLVYLGVHALVSSVETARRAMTESYTERLATSTTKPAASPQVDTPTSDEERA